MSDACTCSASFVGSCLCMCVCVTNGSCLSIEKQCLEENLVWKLGQRHKMTCLCKAQTVVLSNLQDFVCLSSLSGIYSILNAKKAPYDTVENSSYLNSGRISGSEKPKWAKVKHDSCSCKREGERQREGMHFLSLSAKSQQWLLNTADPSGNASAYKVCKTVACRLILKKNWKQN